MTEPELERAVELVERCGGREWTDALAENHIGSAVRVLTGLELPAEVEDALVATDRALVDRRR